MRRFTLWSLAAVIAVALGSFVTGGAAASATAEGAASHGTPSVDPLLVQQLAFINTGTG